MFGGGGAVETERSLRRREIHVARKVIIGEPPSFRCVRESVREPVAQAEKLCGGGVKDVFREKPSPRADQPAAPKPPRRRRRPADFTRTQRKSAIKGLNAKGLE